MNKYAELTAGLDIQAEVSKVRDFLNSNPVGAVTKILVLICVSDRIAYDQPKELVELDARIVVSSHDPSGKQLAVLCPRYPKGLCPGVKIGGLYMLASCSMRPMPKRCSYTHFTS